MQKKKDGYNAGNAPPVIMSPGTTNVSLVTRKRILRDLWRTLERYGALQIFKENHPFLSGKQNEMFQNLMKIYERK